MTEAERQAILSSAKTFFRTRIAENHKANTEKLTSLSKFNINPFTHKYLAQFAFGDSSPESMAKALIYPRVLGTSISTTFGTQLQYFCNEVLSSYASTTSGIDIEFIDLPYPAAQESVLSDEYSDEPDFCYHQLLDLQYPLPATSSQLGMKLSQCVVLDV